MADYAAPVALGIKVPDAMGNLSSIMGAANAAQAYQANAINIQKARETLGADIAQRKAESRTAEANATLAEGTLNPKIEQQSQLTQQSQIATHAAQFKLDSEQGQKLLQMAGGLLAHPDIQAAENAKTPEQMEAAAKGATDAVLSLRDRAYDMGMPKSKIDVQIAPLLTAAAHNPDKLPGILRAIVTGGQSPETQSGTATQPAIVVDTGQQTQVVPKNENPFAAKAPLGPNGTVAPISAVQHQVPITQPVYDPKTKSPGIYGVQPPDQETVGSRPEQSKNENIKILQDTLQQIQLADRAGKQAFPNQTNDEAAAQVVAELKTKGFAVDHGQIVPINRPQANVRIQTGPALGDPSIAEILPAAIKQDWDKTIAAANVAQQNIGVLQNIKKFSGDAITGFAADRRALVNALGDYLGIPAATLAKTNTDQLAKNANMLALVGGSTDAARAISEAANPNIHMNTEAIRHAADQIIAQNKLAIKKAQFLQSSLGNPDEYNHKLVDWNAAADPRILQLKDMSPEEKKALRNSPEWPQFKAKGQKLHNMGVTLE